MFRQSSWRWLYLQRFTAVLARSVFCIKLIKMFSGRFQTCKDSYLPLPNLPTYLHSKLVSKPALFPLSWRERAKSSSLAGFAFCRTWTAGVTHPVTITWHGKPWEAMGSHRGALASILLGRRLWRRTSGALRGPVGSAWASQFLYRNVYLVFFCKRYIYIVSFCTKLPICIPNLIWIIKEPWLLQFKSLFFGIQSLCFISLASGNLDMFLWGWVKWARTGGKCFVAN